MENCLICGSSELGYVNSLGKFCDSCYWEITHDPDPNESGSWHRVKGYDERFSKAEWFERMSIVAKKKGF